MFFNFLLSPSLSLSCSSVDCDTDQETDRLLGAQRSADEKGATYEEKVSTVNLSHSPPPVISHVHLHTVLTHCSFHVI